MWGEPREVYPEVAYSPLLESGWRYGTVVVEWPVHYTRAIENQPDVAYLAFVRRTTIGARGRSFVEGPQADEQDIKVGVTNWMKAVAHAANWNWLRLQLAKKTPRECLPPCVADSGPPNM